MKNIYSIFASLILNISLGAAGYEVDFMVNETPLTACRKVVFSGINFSTASLNGDQGSALLGEEVKPFQPFRIGISDLENINVVNQKDLCRFLNQSIEGKKQQQQWQSLVFTVKEEGRDDEDITLYWAPSRTSLYVNGGSENFVLSAFQHNLPKRDKHGNFKCTVKIDLLSK